MHQIQPTVGQWYLRPETGLKFEVIDIDDGDGMIEIQDEEGTLDQVDSEAWFTEALEATDQPQDSTGAFDTISEPDEADGGDSVNPTVTDPNVTDTESLRVARDEMLSDSQEEEGSEDDDSDLDEEDEEDGNAGGSLTN